TLRALLGIEACDETAREREKRDRSAMLDEHVVNRVALVFVHAEDADGDVARIAMQILGADRIRDRREVFDPGLDAAAALRRLRWAKRIVDRALFRTAADDADGFFELWLHLRDVTEGVLVVQQKIAPLEEREDAAAREEEIVGVVEQVFPLAHDLRRRFHAR